MPAAHSRWRNGTDANRSRGTRRSRRVLFSGDAKLSAAGVLARSFSVWRAKVPHRGRSQINRRCQRSSIVMERQLIGLKVPQSHSWERSFADGVDPNLPFDLTEERVPSLLEKASDQLPATLREPITRLLAHMKELDRQVNELEAQIKAWHRSSTLSQRVAQIPGLDRWARVRWWPRSPMREALPTAGKLQPGWAWCPDKTPAAANPNC